MKATLNDIAQKVGVSKSLVSMYLNNYKLAGRIANETKKKIDEAVRELNYHPSFTACALSKGKTKTIGMICGGIKNSYFAYLAEDAMEEAAKKGYQLLLSLTRWLPEAEEKALENLLNRQIDGLICCVEPERGSRAYQLLRDASIPILFINRKESDFASVCTDFEPVFDKVMKYFAEQGCRKILGGFYQESLWPEFFLRTCRKYGLEAKLISDRLSKESIREQIRSVQDGSLHGYILNGHSIRTRMLRTLPDFPDYKPKVVVGVDDYTILGTSPYIVGGIYTDSPALIRFTVNQLISFLENPDHPSFKAKTVFIKQKPTFLNRDELLRQQEKLLDNEFWGPFPGC